MNKVLLITLLILTSFVSFCQNDWSKDDRNNLYNDYLSVITNHRELADSQRESLALCALKATCEEYTKKEYLAKIDIEISRIHEAQLSICAKNNGIDLGAKKEVVQKSPDSQWTKMDKEKLSKDFRNYLSKHENLTEDQIQKMELCFLSQTTEKYTKNKYDELISIEIKQHFEKSSNECSKSLKIDLNYVAPAESVVEKTATKALLVGTWKTDHGTIITFNDNGTFLRTFNDRIITKNYMHIQNSTSQGDWFMDSKGILTLSENWIEEDTKLFKVVPYKNKSTGKFKFDSISDDFFKMTLIEGGECCQEANKAIIVITQANKVN